MTTAVVTGSPGGIGYLATALFVTGTVLTVDGGSTSR